MAESLIIMAGLDIEDPPIIQDLVYYAEARFKVIILAMCKVEKAPDNIQMWMQKCLRQELVSTVLFSSELFRTFFNTIKHSALFLYSLDRPQH